MHFYLMYPKHGSGNWPDDDSVIHARQVKGDDPDKKGYPGPPGWGFGVELTTQPST